MSTLAERPVLGDPQSVIDELAHVAAAYLHAGEFDLIHDHTGIGPAIGALAASERPVVHTLHGPWTPEHRRLFAILQDQIDLVAISHAQQAANAELAYAGVVYNGVEVGDYPLQTDKEAFLVFLGRVAPAKAPEVAVDIARRAGLPLVMMVKRTEPAQQAYWNEVVVPRLSGHEEVIDEPPHDLKVKLLGRARATLFPINWPEPFGLVMTESMACGTPVIARPLGAAPEVVADGVTGFLCATEDEMVDAVAAAASLRPEDCRARVCKWFSAEAMVEGYEQIYREALANHGARSGHVKLIA